MTPARSRGLLAFVPALLLASFGLFWFSDTVADPDLWGHVRFGQDLLRTGSIVQVDSYSYRTGGRLWINHEWLSELVFATLYDHAGPSGLIALKVLVSLLILGPSYAHLRVRGLGAFRAVFLLVIISSVPFRMGLGTVRPHMFTYLLFLLVLLLLERAASGREARLWALPILFAAWVNLHGGVLAGVGVVGLWVVVRVVDRLRNGAGSPIRRLGGIAPLLLLGAACSVALTVNPYGVELVQFLLRTATVPRPEISEWTPLALTSRPGLFDLGLLAVGIAGLVGSRRRRAPEAVVIFGVMAILPMISNRHYPLFALALVVLAGEHIADVWNRWWPPGRSRNGPGRGVAALGLLVSLLLIGLSVPRFRCIRIEPGSFAFPARAVALLGRAGVRGNMAVPFEWGEYVIWHLGPQVKVSIDGRRETVYSDESYWQSLRFERGTGVWDALLKSAPTDLVLAANGSPTANLMSLSAGWLALYQDACCVVFVREGDPDLDRIVETPVPNLPDNGDGLCFPSPGRRPRGVSRSRFFGKGQPPTRSDPRTTVQLGPS